MSKTLQLGLVLLVSIQSSYAAILTREAKWEWTDSNTTPVQSCSAKIENWYDGIGIELGTRDLGIDFIGAYDHPSGAFWDESNYSQDQNKVELSYRDSTGSHRREIEAEKSDGYFHHTVSAQQLVDVTNADEVYLEITRPASYELWYTVDAMMDLYIVQWLSYWCGDENEDGYCDPIVMPDGTKAPGLLPMRRSTDQVDLADCLRKHQNSKQQIIREDFLISGPVNWPRVTQWSADCSESVEASIPAKPDLPDPTNQELCALFNSYFFSRISPYDFLGDGAFAYICDSGKQYNDEYSGNQIRYQADKQLGEFTGFKCPVYEEGAQSNPTAKDMRFDTRPLRDYRTKQLRPSGVRREVGRYIRQPIEVYD